MLPLIMFKAESQMIIDHLVSLDDESRRLRFGYDAREAAIEKYVNNSFDHSESVWYGFIDGNQCYGAIHIAVDGDVAELGFSIDKDRRGAGLSNELFARALVYIKALGIKKVTMQCLSENKIVQHLAQKHGMAVVTIGPGEKSASMTIDTSGIPYMDKMTDAHADILALVDLNIRSQKRMWAHVMSIFK